MTRKTTYRTIVGEPCFWCGTAPSNPCAHRQPVEATEVTIADDVRKTGQHNPTMFGMVGGMGKIVRGQRPKWE